MNAANGPKVHRITRIMTYSIANLIMLIVLTSLQLAKLSYASKCTSSDSNMTQIEITRDIVVTKIILNLIK